jgi:hypothetical protein
MSQSDLPASTNGTSSWSVSDPISDGSEAANRLALLGPGRGVRTSGNAGAVDSAIG